MEGLEWDGRQLRLKCGQKAAIFTPLTDHTTKADVHLDFAHCNWRMMTTKILLQKMNPARIDRLDILGDGRRP